MTYNVMYTHRLQLIIDKSKTDTIVWGSEFPFCFVKENAGSPTGTTLCDLGNGRQTKIHKSQQ